MEMAAHVIVVDRFVLYLAVIARRACAELFFVAFASGGRLRLVVPAGELAHAKAMVRSFLRRSSRSATDKAGIRSRLQKLEGGTLPGIVVPSDLAHLGRDGEMAFLPAIGAALGADLVVTCFTRLRAQEHYLGTRIASPVEGVQALYRLLSEDADDFEEDEGEHDPSAA